MLLKQDVLCVYGGKKISAIFLKKEKKNCNLTAVLCNRRRESEMCMWKVNGVVKLNLQISVYARKKFCAKKVNQQ
jgi:hypothetical protein